MWIRCDLIAISDFVKQAGEAQEHVIQMLTAESDNEEKMAALQIQKEKVAALKKSNEVIFPLT